MESTNSMPVDLPWHGWHLSTIIQQTVIQLPSSSPYVVKLTQITNVLYHFTKIRLMNDLSMRALLWQDIFVILDSRKNDMNWSFLTDLKTKVGSLWFMRRWFCFFQFRSWLALNLAQFIINIYKEISMKLMPMP